MTKPQYTTDQVRDFLGRYRRALDLERAACSAAIYNLDNNRESVYGTEKKLAREGLACLEEIPEKGRDDEVQRLYALLQNHVIFAIQGRSAWILSNGEPIVRPTDPD